MSEPAKFLRFTSADSGVDFLVRRDLLAFVDAAQDRETKAPVIGVSLLIMIHPQMVPRAVRGGIVEVMAYVNGEADEVKQPSALVTA